MNAGGMLRQWRDTMGTAGNIMSTIGGYHEHSERNDIPQCTRKPPLYS